MDCDGRPEIDDITQGQCVACGHRWCLECGASLFAPQLWCDHWAEDPRDQSTVDDAMDAMFERDARRVSGDDADAD